MTEKKFWFWMGFAVSGVLLALLLTWYVPPRFMPEWTVKNSPFLTQKMMVIRYKDWSLASESDLMERQLFYVNTHNERVLDYLVDYFSELEMGQKEALEAEAFYGRLLTSEHCFDRYLALLLSNESWMRGMTYEADLKHKDAAIAYLKQHDYKMYLNLSVEIDGFVMGADRYIVDEMYEYVSSPSDSMIRLAKCVQLKGMCFLHVFNDAQLDNGSWEDNDKLTAIIALNYLGAGYDHKTPTQHKEVINEALQYLKGLNLKDLSMPEVRWVAVALAEAYAMTMDPSLKDPCQLAAEIISEHINSLIGEPIGSDEIPLIMAHKAMKSAGLSVLKGSYVVERAVRINDVDKLEKRQAAAYWLAMTFSNKASKEVLPLCDFARENFTTLQGSLSVADFEMLYVLHLCSFHLGEEGHRKHGAWFRKMFIHLQAFHFNKAGKFIGYLVPEPMGADRGLEKLAYIGLMFEIEYRSTRIAAKSVASP